MRKIIFIPTLLAVMVGCNQQPTNTGLNPDQVVISYQATIDEQGGCQPTYEALTQTDADGLPVNKIYMINGETYYYDQKKQRIGNIPLQIKMADETMSLLNEVITCEQLQIELVIEECQYEWGTEREGCPPISVKGQDAFGGIEVVFAE